MKANDVVPVLVSFFLLLLCSDSIDIYVSPCIKRTTDRNVLEMFVRNFEALRIRRYDFMSANLSLNNRMPSLRRLMHST